MADINFGVNLIPTSSDTLNLGKNDKKWNLYVNNVNGEQLGTAAYTDSSGYATSTQGILATGAMQKSGGTFTGAVTLNAAPSSDLEAATKKYVDDMVSISDTLGSGTQIGVLTINGVDTTLYAPNAPQTIAVTQSANTPTAEFIVSTNTASSAALTGVLSTTTALANGKIIYYMTAYVLPESAATLNLNYANSGNTTGAIPIYAYGNTRSTTAYPAGCVLSLVYYNNAFYIISPSLAVIM